MNPLFLNKISEINFLFSTQNVTDHTQNLYYFQKNYKRLKLKKHRGPVSDRLLDHRPSIIDDRIRCKPAPNSIVY